MRLPNQVYELVNKRTKFTVVSVCLPPKFLWWVRLPVRLHQKSTLCLPNVRLPITLGWVRLPKVWTSLFPKSSFTTWQINSSFTKEVVCHNYGSLFTNVFVYVSKVYHGKLPKSKFYFLYNDLYTIRNAKYLPNIPANLKKEL